jgi:aminoglycoside phosphotransferase family enzyme/predicted kinase
MLVMRAVNPTLTTMPDPETQDSGNPLIASLRRPGCYPHAAAEVQLLETHISWVLLAGDYAYKIKKPVNLGFLDFSTLELRHRCCLEELRLNKRFAPQLYLDCVAITGDAGQPTVGGDGPVIEYAVCMRRFPQEALASHLLAANALLPRHIEAFASTLADFHRRAARSEAGSVWGAPATPLAAALQNLDVLKDALTTAADAATIAALRAWTMHEHAALHDLILQRQAAGAVRECHGDLHLDNIVLLDDALLPFDCIEFSAELRWNDVLSEAAFLTMDLLYRGESRLAWLFLNAYLEHSGDYDGIRLLPFNLVYRALVRAKIVALRAAQMHDEPAASAQLLQTASSFVALAQTLARTHQPALVITHGLSGSGKSRIAGALMTQAGAVRIRADVERKRLHGMAPQERHGAAAGLYGEQATAATYRRLAELAREILAAGYTAIVDAACLQRWQRELLRGVARTADVPFLNLAVSAPETVLRARISQRQAAGSDPSDAELAVLEQQLQNCESLGADELEDAVELASGDQDEEACCRQALAALNARCAAYRKD